jgi:hypothetical protein
LPQLRFFAAQRQFAAGDAILFRIPHAYIKHFLPTGSIRPVR